jgi:hypothetical protein
MTQEDKNLLLKDLCARLPYKVKGIITYDKSNTTFTVEGIDNNVLHLSDAVECYVEDFKPYLRPMSSMTSVEVLEYISLKESIVASDDMTYYFETYESIDWLNAHHFDYRGLIEKGLALEAPENMYKIYKYDR